MNQLIMGIVNNENDLVDFQNEMVLELSDLHERYNNLPKEKLIEILKKDLKIVIESGDYRLVSSISYILYHLE